MRQGTTRRKAAFVTGALFTVVLALYALPALHAVVGSSEGDCTPAGYSPSQSVACCPYGGYVGGGYSNARGQFGYSNIGGYYCTYAVLAVTDGGFDIPESAYQTGSPYQPVPACTAATSTAVVNPTVAARGQPVTVTGSCFAANQPVTGEFFSAAVGIGSVTTDAAGRYTLTFRVPSDAAAGVHRIVVSGANAQGQRHESIGALTVTVTSTPFGRSGFDLGRWVVPAILAILLGLLLAAAARPPRRSRLL